MSRISTAQPRLATSLLSTIEPAGVPGKTEARGNKRFRHSWKGDLEEVSTKVCLGTLSAGFRYGRDLEMEMSLPQGWRTCRILSLLPGPTDGACVTDEDFRAVLWRFSP